MKNSTYYLDLYNPPQTVPIARAEFTVIVPWQYLPEHSVETEDGLAASATRLPWVRLSPFEEAAVRCDASWYWPDVERLQFERVPATPRYPLSLLLSTTAWKAKAIAHEERHVRFYNEAGECGSKFYTVEDLKAYLRRCADTPTKPPPLGEPACRVRIEDGSVATAEFLARRALESAVEQFNHIENLIVTLVATPMSEWLAYQESDQLSPFYIFKWCMHEKDYGSGPFTCPR